VMALAVLAGCAGGPMGDSLERSLEADSQLEENPPFDQLDQASTATTTAGSAENEKAAAIAGEAILAYPSNGAIAPSTAGASNTGNATPSDASVSITDLDQAPEELRSYLEDLLALNLLETADEADEADEADNAGAFNPNQSVTRREFARWLAAVNNRFYQDDPGQKVRLGVASDRPAFQDVGPEDPDFPYIQGLAEAGIIPSALAGNATAVNFRPDAPLTRETLVSWKVPLDIRQPLPNATIEAIQEAWGFQDAGEIDPAALRPVLADFGNGDFANIRRMFGFTTLLQPKEAVTRAEAAAALWRFGTPTEGISAQDIGRSESGSGDE
ncbi:MAG: S-layer homology domain-containing protein, partial [Cyanobacteria bacterium P01_D01_bin.128]